MNIVQFTLARCPELAEFLEECCVSPLSFEKEDPNHQSADNHIHLFALEWWADHHRWIDLDYRVAFAEFIFERWRRRLKGLPPYGQSGYRFYLYEDLAPTISVTADTPHGFPDPGEPTFVNSIRDIMALYVDRSWIENFTDLGWELPQERILEAVEQNAGSIGKPTAQALGLQVGRLRVLIEQMGIAYKVNAIRKRFRRSPARFGEEQELPFRYQVHEQRLPAGYR